VCPVIVLVEHRTVVSAVHGSELLIFSWAGPIDAGWSSLWNAEPQGAAAWAAAAVLGVDSSSPMAGPCATGGE